MQWAGRQGDGGFSPRGDEEIDGVVGAVMAVDAAALGAADLGRRRLVHDVDVVRALHAQNALLRSGRK